MEIERVSEEDLATLAGLYQQLVPNETSLVNMHKTLLACEKYPNHIILGAKVGGQLVGSCLGVICQMLFGQCKSFMVIEDVVVDANNRRGGVGTALMLEMERLAAERNCSYIMLITDADREDSQRFYKSLGYSSDSYAAFKKHL